MRRGLFALVLLAMSLPVLAGEGRSLIDFGNGPGVPGRSLYAENLAMVCRWELRGDDSQGCKQTVGAVLDTLELVEVEHPTARTFCPLVQPVPWQDAAAVYVAWADRHPDKLKAPGAYAVVVALKERWPCPEKDS